MVHRIINKFVSSSALSETKHERINNWRSLSNHCLDLVCSSPWFGSSLVHCTNLHVQLLESTLWVDNHHMYCHQ